MAGFRPNTYGLNGNDPSGFVEQEATSSLDSLGKGTLSTDWTDEKHSLYLKSMEASFVDQLYDSMDLLGWHRQKEYSTMRPSRTSGQFKVHQNGSWQKIHFEKPEPLNEEADGHHILLTNPWIKHFRAGGRQDAPSTSQENIGSRSQPVYCAPEDVSMQLADNEEVSDQNFIDDDIEEEETEEAHRSKRTKFFESQQIRTMTK